MSDRLLQWAKAGGNVPVGAARPCPLKSLERSIQKANLHYNGDFSRLLDLVRGSITFSSLAELNACLRAIHNDSSVQVMEQLPVEPNYSLFYQRLIYFLHRFFESRLGWADNTRL